MHLSFPRLQPLASADLDDAAYCRAQTQDQQPLTAPDPPWRSPAGIKEPSPRAQQFGTATPASNAALTRCRRVRKAVHHVTSAFRSTVLPPQRRQAFSSASPPMLSHHGNRFNIVCGYAARRSPQGHGVRGECHTAVWFLRHDLKIPQLRFADHGVHLDPLRCFPAHGLHARPPNASPFDSSPQPGTPGHQRRVRRGIVHIVRARCPAIDHGSSDNDQLSVAAADHRAVHPPVGRKRWPPPLGSGGRGSGGYADRRPPRPGRISAGWPVRCGQRLLLGPGHDHHPQDQQL